MMTISRREFLGYGATAVAGTAFALAGGTRLSAYPLDGVMGLQSADVDVLLQNTDPAVVKFQIDVGNMAQAGGDPIMYLTKYPTRYYSMHVKDVGADSRIGIAVGEGTQDWKKIFELAKADNIHNFDVETGAQADVVMEKLRMSAEFLKAYPRV